MSKKVLVRLDGGGVYRTLAEASEALGMAESNISRAINEAGRAKGVRLKWVDRVWAVKEKGVAGWFVGVLNARNTCYVSADAGCLKKVMARDAVEVKDITASWYGKVGTVFVGKEQYAKQEALGCTL